MKKGVKIIELCPATKSLVPVANDFLQYLWQLEILNFDDNPVDYESYINKIIHAENHEFFIKINTIDSFKKVKVSFAEKLNLLNSQPNESVDSVLQRISLEFFCANTICYFSNSNLIKHAVVPQREINRVMKISENLFNALKQIDGIVFSNQTKQYVLQELLDDILSSANEHILNSGKSHECLMREVCGKYLLNQFIGYFGKSNLTDSFLVDQVIEIITSFFPETLGQMDRSDWIRHAKSIRKNSKDELYFQQQKMLEYLHEKTKKRSKLA